MSHQHANIAAALATRLATLALPTAWENSPFTPPAGLYLAESFLPGQTQPFAVTGTDTVGGIYQVLAMAPKGGTKGAGYAAAKQVADLFPRGFRLTYGGQTVTIRSTSQLPAIEAGDRWATPVSVEWWAAV